MKSAPSSTRWVDLAIDVGERLIIIVFALAFIVAAWRAPFAWNRLMIIPEGLTVLFVLFRRSAISVSTYPLDWGLGVAGSIMGLLARPGGDALLAPALCAAPIVLGALISTSAKLSLNTRFGMAPANRGVQPSFAYAFVRHPMYLGYMISDVGFFLLNPTPRNLLVYAVTWVIQLARIYREELWLSRDPAYVAYAATVRRRLIPWVY